jgi:hypothetical protein
MVLGSSITKIKAAIMYRNILKIFIISGLKRERFKYTIQYNIKLANLIFKNFVGLKNLRGDFPGNH